MVGFLIREKDWYHVQEILLGLVQLLQLVLEGQALVFRVGDLKSKVEDKDPFSFPELGLLLNILEEEKVEDEEIK